MLQRIIDWIFFTLLNLDHESKWVIMLNFFAYDVIKIVLLLYFMIMIIGFIRTFISADIIKTWIAGKKGFSHLFASAFGAVTPFCSCSSIPLFISYLQAGIPLGVTFSFLITSPLVNEYLVVLMFNYFGWKITALYVLSGIAIGVISGIVLGKMGLEKHLEKDMLGKKGINGHESFKTWQDRLKFGIGEANTIVKKVWLWLIVGVGIGAVIHNFVPEGTIHSIINAGGIFTVPVATFIGVPMYGSCAAIVPIAVVLFNKGVPLGTALVFMMATAALSLPEAVILRRVMNLKLILIFFAIVTVAIIITGYLFNALQFLIV